MIIVTTNKATYTGDGSTTEFVVTFPFGATSELKLFLHDITANTDTEITSNWAYNNPTGLNPYGSITYPSVGEAIASTKQIVIIRSTALTQEKDHTVKLFTSEDVEGMADKLTREVQDIKEIASRSIQYPASYTGSVDANYYINELTTLKDTATTQAGIATTKAGEAATSAANAAASETKAQKWAEGSDADVAALGGTKSAKGWANVSQAAAESDAVQSVYANMSSITDVAGIKDDVTNVASIKNAVVAVNANESKINTVYDNLANVNTVASNIGNVNTVAGISGNVTTVAGVSTAVTAVSENATDISSVAGNISNVNAVAANETNINAVNSNKTNIDAVAGNNTNITAVANNATNINAVNANKTNINTVAGIDQDVTTVATNVQDISDVADALTNIGAVADDLTNIDAVADDLTNIDTAVANLPDLQDKQNKALTTPLTINGAQETTVEGALGALNTARAELDSNGFLKDTQNPYASATTKGAVKISVNPTLGYLDFYTESN